MESARGRGTERDCGKVGEEGGRVWTDRRKVWNETIWAKGLERKEIKMNASVACAQAFCLFKILE